MQGGIGVVDRSVRIDWDSRRVREKFAGIRALIHAACSSGVRRESFDVDVGSAGHSRGFNHGHIAAIGGPQRRDLRHRR